MKNMSYVITGVLVIALWTSNIFLLNTISEKEKEYAKKKKINQEIHKEYEKIVLEYDEIVDLEKIRAEMLAKGFKQTRDIVYFQVENKNIPEKHGQ
ncbi:MAG: hypothetical protein ACRCTS_01025 [Fusobacteriaceae bacterium]